MVQETLKIMLSAFDSVKDQPVESHRFGELSKDPAHFGVVKQLRDNDPELHENQTMYSCGSLAPKMRRKGVIFSDFYILPVVRLIFQDKISFQK